MATQQKKVVTKRVYESATSSEGEFQRSSRTPSPARVTRLQEKEQLTSLNDRLAAYIDHIRSLENENQRLHLQVQSFEETSSREVSNVKDLYEKELQAARKLIDELSKDNAQLTVSLGTYKSDSEEWMRKYTQRDRDLISLQKKFDEVDALVEKLQADCNIRCKERDESQSELTKLKAEIGELEQQLTTVKKQLEDQILSKVELENKVTTLKEELAFKANLHETELNETRSRVEYSIDHVDSSTRQEYDYRLKAALADFREQHEEQISLLRSELEILYEAKITGLQNELNQQDNMDGKSRTEMNSFKTNISHLQSQIAKLTNQNGHLEARVAELTAELAAERDLNKSVIESKDTEIRTLREEIDEQLREYHDLLDLKISLDLEISAYRKLLEGEEERLNKSFDTTSSTQVKSTPRKRRRVENRGDIETGSAVQSDIQIDSNFTAALQILDVSSEEKYVKIQNSSDSEISLKGWKIVQTVNGEQTEYKFPAKTKLDSEQTLTIWSSDCDVTADSSNVFMKTGSWSVDHSTDTCILDKEGEVKAVYNKTQVERVIRTGTRRSQRQTINKETTETSGKCSIM